MKDEEFLEEVGLYFVEFVCEFGYGDVLALLGRQLRDFLNGLDNLHEYLKYSYPRLVQISFIIQTYPNDVKLLQLLIF